MLVAGSTVYTFHSSLDPILVEDTFVEAGDQPVLFLSLLNYDEADFEDGEEDYAERVPRCYGSLKSYWYDGLSRTVSGFFLESKRKKKFFLLSLSFSGLFRKHLKHLPRNSSVF